MSVKRTIVVLLLILTLLFGGCGDGKEAEAPAAVVSVREYESKANGLSFSYPVGWTVQESGSAITITSVAGLDCGAAIVDITNQVELFLAGHGDLIASVEALMQKNAALFAGGSTLESYAPNVTVAQNGSVVGVATFSYQQGGKTYDCQLAVTQFGGRVLLDVFGRDRNAEKAAELDSMYESTIASLQLNGTEGVLTPADLTELGFPEAPYGCYRYYNPVSGQFLIIPETYSIFSKPYDRQVVLYSEDYGMIVTQNWTDRFYELYSSNGGDLEQCYAVYLDECLDVAETVLGRQVAYRNFKYDTTVIRKELIKARFYIDLDWGEVRCFAELAARGTDDQYVQGTFVMSYTYDVNAAIDASNVVMGYSEIVFPLS
ncbi:MAG TPA: hypothetical protein VN512_07515 [Clostridia bacterium]|nr:hypothetical protein [Clostridia bacterium]